MNKTLKSILPDFITNAIEGIEKEREQDRIRSTDIRRTLNPDRKRYTHAEVKSGLIHLAANYTKESAAQDAIHEYSDTIAIPDRMSKNEINRLVDDLSQRLTDDDVFEKKMGTIKRMCSMEDCFWDGIEALKPAEIAKNAAIFDKIHPNQPEDPNDKLAL
ncbi:MAG: hypothetical protein ACTHOO_01200 [Alcanivorax sp.]